MKQFTIKSLVLGSMAALIFACGSSNSVISHGLISKRKYTSGFHVNNKGNWKSSKEDQATATVETKVESKKETASIQLVKEQTFTAPKSNREVQTLAIAAPKNEQTNDFTATSAVNNETASMTVAQERTQKRFASNKEVAQKLNKHAVKAAKKESRGMRPEPIVFILLSLFIPFVAVGLATDWEAKPVICNLLWSLLCGIPGIIHAFVVCKRERAI